VTDASEQALCAETSAIERAAVKAYAADHRRRIEVQIAKGRISADEGTLIAKQVEVFAEGVAIGLHMQAIEPREIRIAVRAALAAAGLDGRPKARDGAEILLPPEPVKTAGKTADFETSRGETSIQFEGRTVEVARGPVRLSDAPGLTSVTIDHADPAKSRVGVIVYRPARAGEELGAGMIGQMEASVARNFGASLLRLADKLDGGVKS
jgi:hypothetical protein